VTTQAFSPHLEILPPAQRRLWNELNEVPNEFVLYGGTAIALHLGHRQSVDFDFFGSRDIDPARLQADVPFLADARVTQREKNTLSVIIDRGGSIKVSFFGVPALKRLVEPHVVPENALRIATLLDLAGTKASVVQVRAEAKDYRDLDALMTQAGITLPDALAAASAIYGPSFNPEITLKALSYFEDGDVAQIPRQMKDRLAARAREVDLDRLPRMSPL
jgi:hypothetical protein